MKTKELTVLMVEPGQHPKVTTIKDDLDSLQKAVSIGADYQGLIEFVSLSITRLIQYSFYQLTKKQSGFIKRLCFLI